MLSDGIRSTDLFIAYTDQTGLGEALHERPIGIGCIAFTLAFHTTHACALMIAVIRGMETLDKIYDGYGDMQPFNEDGVDYGRVFSDGYEYLRSHFPKLDYIQGCIEVDEFGQLLNEPPEEIQAQGSPCICSIRRVLHSLFV